MQPQAKRDQVNGTTVAFGGLATHISLARVYNFIKFMFSLVPRLSWGRGKESQGTRLVYVNLCSIQGVVYRRGFVTTTCTSIKIEDLHQ